MTEVDALSAAGWAWSLHARQADLSGMLAATGPCASTGGGLVCQPQPWDLLTGVDCKRVNVGCQGYVYRVTRPGC